MILHVRVRRYQCLACVHVWREGLTGHHGRYTTLRDSTHRALKLLEAEGLVRHQEASKNGPTATGGGLIYPAAVGAPGRCAH